MYNNKQLLLENLILKFFIWTGIRALFVSGKSNLGLILTISARMPVYMY